MSVSANYPTIRPSLLLDFANTQRLDPRITFTRTTTATYYDANGVLQTAASGVARFDHNPTTGESLGLLVEEQRTNINTNSANFTTWSKVNTTVTGNTAVAPDGTTTADTVAANLGSNTTYIRKDFSGLVNGQQYTISFFVKNINSSGFWARILNLDGSANTSVFPNIQTSGSDSGTGWTRVSVGNGWYRIFITVTANATAGFRFYWYPSGGIDNGQSVYLWGAQLEEGAFPTSYIATTSATVTRNADEASMTGTNFSSWFNNAEGTMYVQSGPSSPVANIGQISLTFNDGGSNNRMYVGKKFDSTTVTEFGVTTGGTGQAFVLSTPTASMTNFKLAAAYRLNDFASVASGGAVGTDALGTVPVVNQLLLGRIGTSSDFLNGTIRKIAYYPIRVTDAQLQALTS